MQVYIFPAHFDLSFYTIFMCFEKSVLMNTGFLKHANTYFPYDDIMCLCKGGSELGYSICMSWVLEKLLLALSKNREGGRMEEEEDSKTEQRTR